MTVIVPIDKVSDNIRVNFSSTGLSKVVPSVRALDLQTPDRGNIVEIANILARTSIFKELREGFKSIQEFVGLDYIGYIIQKDRLDKSTGEWRRIDEYRIIGSDSSGFKDTRVAYGNLYRYRIKSVMKVTFAVPKESSENRELIEDIRTFEAKRIKEELQIQNSLFSDIDRITNQGLTSKVSSGKPATVFDLIEGLSMRADENSTDIISSPVENPKDKLALLRQLQNLRAIDLDIVKGIISRERLQKLINNSIERFRERTIEYVSFYYESEPSKTWHYVDITESVPPPPPESIKIIPSTPKNEILVTWLKPANSQRDIKSFVLYRRRSLRGKWRVLKRLDQTENFFIDRAVLKRLSYMYAISCVDVHGIQSFLSAQIIARLNPNFKIEGREIPLKWHSGSGVDPKEVNTVLKKFLKNDEQLIAKRNISIGPTTRMNPTSEDLIIRVTSLDTHEVKEFKVKLKNVNVQKHDMEE